MGLECKIQKQKEERERESAKIKRICHVLSL